MYGECLEQLQVATKVSTQFLEANENFCIGITEGLKKLYDFVKNEEIKTAKSNALQVLITQDFDLEQIWQQIELQNDSVIAPLLTVVSKLVVTKAGLSFSNQTNHVLEDLNFEHNAEEECNDTKSEESNIDEIKKKSSDAINENSDNEVNLEDSECDDDYERVENNTDTNIKPSIVDDKFFKLAEMEHFLEIEEKKGNDPDSGNDSDDKSESEASIDLFGPDINDDEEKMKTAKYKDFFEAKRNSRKKLKPNIHEEGHPQSSFELRQSRLDERIYEIEEDAVEEKGWELKGEITAENRPQNSLLEEIVEFDLTAKPAPIMTEQTTMQLEDIIKQRIKDRIFDSVERKIKPAETLHDYKKKLVLDQEKSKKSLAQIYEEEFLEQQTSLDNNSTGKEGKEPEFHQEINTLLKNLFVKLDALSNFHFTPKPIIPELKVVSNLPAVTVEEVAPLVTSDSALLAPEEIQKKSKADLIGNKERTVTDKKRERRKKKLKQKIHAKEKHNLGKKKGNQKIKTRDKIDKNEGNFEDIKSSKAFFIQLQAQVRSHVKRKSFSGQNGVGDNVSSAKRLKL